MCTIKVGAMQNILNILTTVILSLMPVFALAQAKNKPKSTATQHTIYIPCGSGIKHYPPAQEKIIDERAEAWFREQNRLKQRADDDLQMHDYPAAVINYRRILKLDPMDSYASYGLAYALLGLHRNAEALAVLHAEFYRKGSTLYTSGFMMKPYITYALLEDEAGNWREAALAYDLAGGKIAKTQNCDMPNIVCSFNANNPQPLFLKAAANAVLGICSFNTHYNDTGNAAFSDALAYFHTATRLEPHWPVAWYYLSLVLARAGHQHQGDRAYNRALSAAGGMKQLYATQAH